MNWGHSAAQIWGYTPRQAYAWMMLGNARTQRERAVAIADGAVATQSDGKQIKRAIDQLSEA